MLAFLQGHVLLSSVVGATLLNGLFVLTKSQKKKNGKKTTTQWSRIIIHELALFFVFFVLLTFLVDPVDSQEVFVDDPEF